LQGIADAFPVGMVWEQHQILPCRHALQKASRVRNATPSNTPSQIVID